MCYFLFVYIPTQFQFEQHIVDCFCAYLWYFKQRLIYTTTTRTTSRKSHHPQMMRFPSQHRMSFLFWFNKINWQPIFSPANFPLPPCHYYTVDRNTPPKRTIHRALAPFVWRWCDAVWWPTACKVLRDASKCVHFRWQHFSSCNRFVIRIYHRCMHAVWDVGDGWWLTACAHIYDGCQNINSTEYTSRAD